MPARRQGGQSLEMLVGGILKAVQNLEGQLAEMKKEVKEEAGRVEAALQRSETHAAASRQRLYQRQDDISKAIDDQVAVFKLHQVALQDLQKVVVEDIKPVTDDVKRWKLMGVGALFVTGIAASAITSAVAYFWTDIARWWRSL